MITALIIGREGSVGLPKKNIMKIKGLPLMAYPILAAKNTQLVDEIYLSTDSGLMKNIAREYGCKIIDRPPELSTDKALADHAFEHGYRVIKEYHKEDLELLVLLFCNCATISSDLIDEGVKVLRNNPEYDSAVSVSCYNMWSPLRARKIGEDGLLHPFVPFESFGDPRNLNCDRDSQGDSWFADMSISVVRPQCLANLEEGLLPQKWMGRKIYPLKQEFGLDIDADWQIPVTEYWLGKYGIVDKIRQKY